MCLDRRARLEQGLMQRELLEFEDAMQLLPAEAGPKSATKAATEGDTHTEANVELKHVSGESGNEETLATAQHRFATGAHRYCRSTAQTRPPPILTRLPIYEVAFSSRRRGLIRPP